MGIYSYKSHAPQISKGCFIAESADVIGDVSLGENSSVWFQTVLRGDDDKIIVGKNVNIQDLCMVHVIQGGPTIIEDNVSIGHSVTLHACTIGEGSLVGMGSTILDGAVVNKNSVVAAGSILPPGKEYPAGVLLMGSPAKIVRYLRPEEIERYSNHYKSYLERKDEYLDSKLVQKLSSKEIEEVSK